MPSDNENAPKVGAQWLKFKAWLEEAGSSHFDSLPQTEAASEHILSGEVGLNFKPFIHLLWISLDFAVH